MDISSVDIFTFVGAYAAHFLTIAIASGADTKEGFIKRLLSIIFLEFIVISTCAFFFDAKGLLWCFIIKFCIHLLPDYSDMLDEVYENE